MIDPKNLGNHILVKFSNHTLAICFIMCIVFCCLLVISNALLILFITKELKKNILN